MVFFSLQLNTGFYSKIVLGLWVCFIFIASTSESKKIKDGSKNPILSVTEKTNPLLASNGNPLVLDSSSSIKEFLMESLHLFEEWEASMVPIHSTEHLELSFLDALFDPPRVELYLPPNNKNRRRRDVETNSLLTISDTKKPTLTITTDTNVAADPVSPTTPNTSIPPPIQGTTVPSQPPPPPPPPVVEGNVDSDPPSSIPNGPSTSDPSLSPTSTMPPPPALITSTPTPTPTPSPSPTTTTTSLTEKPETLPTQPVEEPTSPVGPLKKSNETLPAPAAEIANLLQQTHPDPSTQKDPVKDAKEVLAHVSLVAPKVPQQNALTKPINHPREEVRAEGQGDGSGPLKKDQDKSMELEFLTSQRQGTKEDPEKSDGALSNTAFVATIVTPFAAVVVFLVALVGYRRHKFKRNSPP